MSSGIKAYYDELDEKIAEDRKTNFSKLDQHSILYRIDSALEELTRLAASDPALTKTNWARLDSAIKHLKALC